MTYYNEYNIHIIEYHVALSSTGYVEEQWFCMISTELHKTRGLHFTAVRV